MSCHVKFDYNFMAPECRELSGHELANFNFFLIIVIRSAGEEKSTDVIEQV